VKNTLGSESSCSSGSCGEVAGRRKKEYGRKDRKTVRILTVFAYILCVSLAAVLLSVYYVFLWNPGPVPEKNTRGPPPTSPQQSFSYKERLFKQNSGSPSRTDQWEGSRLRKSSSSLHSQFVPYYGNTRAYQQHQIPTPLPLLMTTHFLTTLPEGVPTTKPTTTTPTPPIFKLVMNAMV